MRGCIFFRSLISSNIQNLSSSWLLMIHREEQNKHRKTAYKMSKSLKFLNGLCLFRHPHTLWHKNNQGSADAELKWIDRIHLTSASFSVFLCLRLANLTSQWVTVIQLLQNGNKQRQMHSHSQSRPRLHISHSLCQLVTHGNHCSHFGRPSRLCCRRMNIKYQYQKEKWIKISKD